MPNTTRPDLSALPRMTEPLDNDELTAHFAVPRELLEQLRDDDDATRVGPMPAGLLEDERNREIRADQVHTAATLPPPAPEPVQAVAPRQASAPAGRAAFTPTSDAELLAQVSAMLRPQRVARGLFLALLLAVGALALAWGVLWT